MVTREREVAGTVPSKAVGLTNGAGMAALLAAAVGAFAMGLIIMLGEVGVLSVPAIYAPAGGVTGRTTLAVLVWLITWAALHARWKERQVDGGRVGVLALLLVGLGVLGTFPPVWGLIP